MGQISIPARFKNAGTPETGLSPTVTIKQVRGETITTIESNKPMLEDSDGVYNYVFKSFNVMYSYIFLFDGTATLDDGERYIDQYWSGVQDWIDQVPRGGGGSSYEVEMTKKQFEELAKRLMDLMSGMEIELPKQFGKKEVLEAVKRLESSIEDKQKCFSKKMDKVVEKKMKLISEKIKLIKDRKIDKPKIDFKILDDKFDELAEFIEILSKKQRDSQDSLAEFIELINKK